MKVHLSRELECSAPGLGLLNIAVAITVCKWTQGCEGQVSHHALSQQCKARAVSTCTQNEMPGDALKGLASTKQVPLAVNND